MYLTIEKVSYTSSIDDIPFGVIYRSVSINFYFSWEKETHIANKIMDKYLNVDTERSIRDKAINEIELKLCNIIQTALSAHGYTSTIHSEQ